MQMELSGEELGDIYEMVTARLRTLLAEIGDTDTRSARQVLLRKYDRLEVLRKKLESAAEGSLHPTRDGASSGSIL